MPELEFGNVQGQVLFANLVERPDDAPLEDAPKTFDGIRVDGPVDVLAVRVADDFMGYSRLMRR